MVTLSNCGTSFFAGFVIFAIIGFMAEQLNIDIEDAAVGGMLRSQIYIHILLKQMTLTIVWLFEQSVSQILGT